MITRCCGMLCGMMLALTTSAFARGPSENAVVLSQQVWALQTLHDLDLEPAQLTALRAAIPALEEDNSPHAGANVPAKFIGTLQSLRQALIRDEDTDEAKDQIDELRDDLESIREDEQVVLDDHVKIADGARAAVPAVMKLLRPSQLAAYFAAYQDEVPDPVQLLVTAVDESRGRDAGKYQAEADRTAHEIGTLLAGLDKDKEGAAAERIRHWLDHAHGLSDAEFKSARSQLESAAREAIGEVDSIEVLRHWVQRDLAELLSNSQLGAMIDERIKHAGK